MIEVVAAALMGSDDKVLMHQRPLAKMHGGLWEFPGGKIEPGETGLQALARELEEELAIVIQSESVAFVALVEDRVAGIRIELWKVAKWRGDPRCVEGEAIAWTEMSTLLKLPMPPLDIPLAKALIAAITGLPSRDDPLMCATPTRP